MNLVYIRYGNGRVLEGVILHLTEEIARIAIREHDDVTEFRPFGGQWLCEDGEPVVFECPDAPVLHALMWSGSAGLWAVSQLVN